MVFFRSVQPVLKNPFVLNALIAWPTRRDPLDYIVMAARSRKYLAKSRRGPLPLRYARYGRGYEPGSTCNSRHAEGTILRMETNLDPGGTEGHSASIVDSRAVLDPNSPAGPDGPQGGLKGCGCKPEAGTRARSGAKCQDSRVA